MIETRTINLAYKYFVFKPRAIHIFMNASALCDNEYAHTETMQWKLLHQREDFGFRRNACLCVWLHAVEKRPSGFLPWVAAWFCEQIPDRAAALATDCCIWLYSGRTQKGNTYASDWPHGGFELHANAGRTYVNVLLSWNQLGDPIISTGGCSTETHAITAKRPRT